MNKRCDIIRISEGKIAILGAIIKLNNKEKILEKIKKCFALSKSTNPHEAAVALKQAHAMIKKHKIDNNIANLCEMTSGRNLKATNLGELSVYQAQLLEIITTVFLVKAVIFPERLYYSNNCRFNTTIKFFGHESDIIIAEYAWVALNRQLISCRKAFIETHTDMRMKKTTKTKRADIYAIGWVMGIYHEIQDLRRDMTPAEVQKHIGKIDNYIDVVHNQLVTCNRKPNPVECMSEQEYNAYLKGLKDGESVTIGKGVNGSVFTPELLN